MINKPKLEDNTKPNSFQSAQAAAPSADCASTQQLQYMIQNNYVDLNSLTHNNSNVYLDLNQLYATTMLNQQQLSGPAVSYSVHHTNLSSTYKEDNCSIKSKVQTISLIRDDHEQEINLRHKEVNQIPINMIDIPSSFPEKNYSSSDIPIALSTQNVIVLDPESGSISIIEIDESQSAYQQRDKEEQFFSDSDHDCEEEHEDDLQYNENEFKEGRHGQGYDNEDSPDNENDDYDDQSLQILDKRNFIKQTAQKTKRMKKIKSEKQKFQEYVIMPKKRHTFLKDKQTNKNNNMEQVIGLQILKPVPEDYKFFLFCDIVIEYNNIIGTKMQQSKRSQVNYYKSISHLKEYKDSSNLFEVALIKTRETLMEFGGAKEYLLSLSDRYAKQVYDSLQNLQEKTRLGLQTATMIHNNRAQLDYIIRRKEYSNMKYEEFKTKTLPNYKYYIYNHYVFDTRTGNIGYTDVGLSKDFLKILCINPEYFQAMMKKYGIIDFLKKDYKTAFTISYFNQYAYNMRNFPKIVRFTSDFITLDNIEIRVDIEHQLIDLCREFDDLNNFDCPFIDFIGFIIPQITDDIVDNLTRVRDEQNINIEQLLDMNDDEIDFFYNQESQSFMKRYYSEIFNRDILVNNLKHQKLDFTA